MLHPVPLTNLMVPEVIGASPDWLILPLTNLMVHEVIGASLDWLILLLTNLMVHEVIGASPDWLILLLMVFYTANLYHDHSLVINCTTHHSLYFEAESLS